MNKRSRQALPIFDGHNDTLLDLFLPERGGRSFLEESQKGHIDLPRAREGGLSGGIFAICAPAPRFSKESDPMYGFTITKNGYDIKMRSPVKHEYASELTNSVLDYAEDLEKKANGLITIIHKYKDLLECMENDIFAIVLHFEGAEAIKEDLSNLQEYYDRGLRSLGLVWSRANAFGTGVPYKFPHSPDTGPGLTNLGKELVRECNRLGVMIDLAHINEKGFWDVAKLSNAPLVVTHSNVHALCPTTRNLTDEQIDAIGASNGVIGVSFVPENLNPNGMPDPNTPLTVIADHIDYIVQKIGIDHAAFGSDFDGAEMPDDIRDVAALPNLIETFRNRGYDNGSLEKIAYKNWLRVLRTSWKVL
jgi:membrane dipeptidase